MEKARGKRTSRQAPDPITDRAYTFAAFTDGKVLPGKRCECLPAMGWNSWNAFGNGNTQELTKQMADAIPLSNGKKILTRTFSNVNIYEYAA